MRTLVVILGPTGVGKSDLSAEIAKCFATSVISCDSRQVYKEMHIGTAVPEPELLSAVPHFFIQEVSVKDYYSCWEFEQQALLKLDGLFESREVVVMTGGSMMYIDAVCKGMDEIPDVDPEVRKSVMHFYQREGIESLRLWLKKLDPDFYQLVDLKNAKRLMHAVEICLTTGKPYSSLRSGSVKQRNFRIIKIGLNREKAELYDRINLRVEQMVSLGLIEEARSLYPYRNLNALNTVGYKEMFAYLDGEIDLPEAIRLIQRNTRHYAKKQLSWFRRDEEIIWFHPAEKERIFSFLREMLEKTDPEISE